MDQCHVEEGSDGLPKGSLFVIKVKEKKTNEQLNESIAGDKLNRMVKLRRQNKDLRALIRNLRGKNNVL